MEQPEEFCVRCTVRGDGQDVGVERGHYDSELAVRIGGGLPADDPVPLRHDHSDGLERGDHPQQYLQLRHQHRGRQ